jgi:hypothetical protein
MYLGQDENFSFSQVTAYDPNITPNVYSAMSTDTWSSGSTPSTDSWWSGITGALVPISTAAANIIRAVTGQSPTAQAPTGYTRNPQGQLVRLPAQGFDFQSLLLPAALGVGAYMLLKKR